MGKKPNVCPGSNTASCSFFLKCLPSFFYIKEKEKQKHSYLFFRAQFKYHLLCAPVVYCNFHPIVLIIESASCYFKENEIGLGGGIPVVSTLPYSQDKNFC